MPSRKQPVQDGLEILAILIARKHIRLLLPSAGKEEFMQDSNTDNSGCDNCSKGDHGNRIAPNEKPQVDICV